MNLRDLGLIRVDLQIVAAMIEDGARVLDVGCGDGSLLAYLDRHKNVDGRGIELSMAGVSACVAQGLSVIQGDADTDLKDYPDHAFDYVVLSQTLQATYDPKGVINHMLRIGRHAIVSFPNFGHWRVRWQLVAGGRMPVTGVLQHQWFDTPNIHLCTIRDFVSLCRELGISIERGITLDSHGDTLPWSADRWPANLLGDQAVFLLTRR
jgi:methionine biosynthesis protein MetW